VAIPNWGDEQESTRNGFGRSEDKREGGIRAIGQGRFIRPPKGEKDDMRLRKRI